MSEKCPKCGSTKLSGLMSSFWVKLDENGDPEGQWSDWASNSELTTERTCQDCEEEFEL